MTFLVAPGDTKILEKFITNDLPDTFRYFRTHDVEYCIKNNKIFLAIDESGEPVGYVHIDKDNDTNWLGLCILPRAQNKNLGTRLIEEILKDSPRPIHLTVDRDNLIAYNLYLKYGFSVCRETPQVLTMRLV